MVLPLTKLPPIDPSLAGLLGGSSPASPAQASSIDPALQGLLSPSSTTRATGTQRATPSAWNYINPLGIVEAAGSLASGLGAQIAGGLAGLGDMGVRAFDKTALPPADVVRRVENDLTYQPRTPLGQALVKGVSWPFQELAKGANWAGGHVTDATGSPLAGALTNTAIQALPMALGAKAPDMPDVPIEAEPRVAPEVAQARAMGLKLTPTQAQAEGGGLGRTVESLTGTAKLERAVSRANATTAANAAAREIGIKGSLSDSAIQATKLPHNAIYNEVGKLGEIPVDDQFRQQIGAISNPGAGSFAFDTPADIAKLKEGYGSLDKFDAGDAVQKVRQLRRDATSNITARYNPTQQAFGFAQKHVADALESQIERHLQNVVAATPAGETPKVDPTLMDRFQKARQSLAKINNVETAFKAAKGQGVSASSLAKQMERGAPLTGDLRTIAEAGQHFPRALQDLHRLRDSGPLSNLDMKIEGGLGVLSPLAAVKAAPLFLTSPLLRKFLASDMYQRMAFDRPLHVAPSFPWLGNAARALPFMQPMQQSPLAGLLAAPPPRPLAFPSQ